MDMHKIDNYQADNTRSAFPYWRSLDSDECSTLREKLDIAFGGIGGTNTFDKLDMALSHIPCVRDENAQDEGFNMDALLTRVSIHPEKRVYINWGRLDKIDIMHYTDLVRHFSDIWYPIADDIEIFDDQLNWIVQVSHEGYVTVAKRSGTEWLQAQSA
jgi:hypothetical protein